MAAKEKKVHYFLAFLAELFLRALMESLWR